MKLFLIPILLVACTKDNDPIQGIDTGDKGFAPSGGNYTISSTINDNGCSSWGSSFNDSIDGFELKITFPDTDTATFHWVNPMDCPKESNVVTCETSEPLVLDDYAPDSDAVIYYEDLTELTWDTESTASGNWIVDLSCEGTQCEIIGDLNDVTYPCSIIMDWTLSKND